MAESLDEDCLRRSADLDSLGEFRFSTAMMEAKESGIITEI